MDKYQSFVQLVQYENSKKFNIDCDSLSNSSFLIFTPHGGGIEPGTSEICKKIQSKTFSYYLFEGIGIDCKRLHITSINFDDEKLLEMIRFHDYAVSIHGMNDNVKKKIGGDIYIGGLNTELIEIATKGLKECDFSVVNNISYPDSPLAGLNMNNITNKCRTKKGMQIEISEHLREKFFTGGLKYKSGRKEATDLFDIFCNIVIQSINIFNQRLKQPAKQQ